MIVQIIPPDARLFFLLPVKISFFIIKIFLKIFIKVKLLKRGKVNRFINAGFENMNAGFEYIYVEVKYINAWIFYCKVDQDERGRQGEGGGLGRYLVLDLVRAWYNHKKSRHFCQLILFGVHEGARTPGLRNHNPTL